MDLTYYLTWKYPGLRFQGAGVDLTTENLTVTGSNGFRSRSVSGRLRAKVIALYSESLEATNAGVVH